MWLSAVCGQMKKSCILRSFNTNRMNRMCLKCSTMESANVVANVVMSYRPPIEYVNHYTIQIMSFLCSISCRSLTTLLCYNSVPLTPRRVTISILPPHLKCRSLSVSHVVWVNEYMDCSYWVKKGGLDGFQVCM